MKIKSHLYIFFIVFVSLAPSGLASKACCRERVYYIEERIKLKDLPQTTKGLRVWIPYPANDSLQKVDDIKLVAPVEAKVIEDRKNQNKILYLSSNQNLNKKEIEILLSFKVNRKEDGPTSEKAAAYEALTYYLKPNRLMPTNGRIKHLAKKITAGKVGDSEKARAIYDYIIGELTYAKDDPRVCGIGNTLLTLKFKKGMCTDYHSLFISLARSLGIPAKFEIGLPIPQDKKEGLINGYHCWAKFYLKDKGWVPVDISEADKHPEKRDYFFGNIDENRVHLTTGRDIILKDAKNNQPLNFFVFPYIELNGLQFKNVDIEISYKS